MIKYTDYDVVFGEVPDEVTLAINLSLCPNRCEGCHSPQLWGDIGRRLIPSELEKIALPYYKKVTCLCFMGGDNDHEELSRLVDYARFALPNLKLAWYSGKTFQHEWMVYYHKFDYFKVGPYIKDYGPLNEPSTNQEFYKVEGREFINITDKFWNKNNL